MTKISSGSLFYTKRIFPLFWFGFVGVMFALLLANGNLQKSPAMFIVPCVMAVFGYVLMKKLVWDLVDEVYDAGDFLVVRNRGEEEQVPLTNIMNVSASTNVNPPRITLRLVNPGRFGSEIAFSPPRVFSLNPFAKNKVAEDLIVRVDQARSKRSS